MSEFTGWQDGNSERTQNVDTLQALNTKPLKFVDIKPSPRRLNSDPIRWPAWLFKLASVLFVVGVFAGLIIFHFIRLPQ